MGSHVHFKDGKFNVWSTVTDSYVLKEWSSDKEVVDYFVQRAIIKAVDDAKEMVDEAHKNNGCSIPYPTYRCKEI